MDLFGKKPPVSKTQPDEHRELIGRLHALRQEAQHYRGRADHGQQSLEAEWALCAHRYMGNHDDLVSGDASREIERSGRVNKQTGDTLHRPLRAQLPRTQNAIIANTAAEAAQPIRPTFKPVETGDSDLWFLTQRCQRRIAAAIQAEQESIRADMDALEQYEDPDTDLELETAVATMIEDVIDTDHRFAFLTEDQRTGRKGLDEEAYDELVALLPDLGLTEERALVAVNDAVLTRAVQQLVNHYWDAADTDLHVMLMALQSKVYGQQCMEFRWIQGKGADLLNIPILDVWIDPQHYELGRSHYLMIDRLMSVGEAMALYPDHTEAVRQAASRGTHAVSDGAIRRSSIFRNVDYGREMVTVTVAWVRHETMDDRDDAPCLRQVVWLPEAGHVLATERCRYADIPAAWTINVPRPDMGPYGQGEPIRLRDIDREINRLMSVIANFMRKNEYPMMIIPQSLYDGLKKAGISPFARPGAMLPVDDTKFALIQQGRGIEGMTLKGPPLDASVVNYLQWLLGQHDSASGHSDIMQGRAPYAGASGEAIQSLAASAAAPIAFKGRFLEHAIERLAREFQHAVANFLNANDWQEVLSVFEVPVLEELIQRCRKARWNVRIEIGVGRGAAQEADKAQARNDHAAGFVSHRTALQRAGEDDPDAELQRLREEQQPTGQAEAVEQTAEAPGAAVLAGLVGQEAV